MGFFRVDLALLVSGGCSWNCRMVKSELALEAIKNSGGGKRSWYKWVEWRLMQNGMSYSGKYGSFSLSSLITFSDQNGLKCVCIPNFWRFFEYTRKFKGYDNPAGEIWEASRKDYLVLQVTNWKRTIWNALTIVSL